MFFPRDRVAPARAPRARPVNRVPSPPREGRSARAAREPGAFRHPGSSTGRVSSKRGGKPRDLRSRGPPADSLVPGGYRTPRVSKKRGVLPRDLRSRGESPRHPVHGPPRALRAPHGERVPGEAPRVPYGNSGFGSEGGPPVFLRNTGTRALSARGRGKSLDQNQLVFSTSQLKPLLTVDLTPIKRVIFPRPNGEHSS
jgi:hypothetical protein